MIRIESVIDKQGLKAFLAVAPPLYRDVPAWVQPLDLQLRSRLDQGKDPFWRHAERELLLAHDSGGIVGRLLVMHDRLFTESSGERVATFGLFEASPDPGVATALFAAAEMWAKKRGLVGLFGPFFLSIHDEVGLLVEGFDRSPCILMPYGRDYYPGLLEQSGFRPVREFRADAWDIQGQAVPDPGVLRPGIVIRNFDKQRINEEVRRFRFVYNDAFAHNWGFVPMTAAEAESSVGDFLRYADLALPKVAEVRGEPAGFILALPDLNEVLRRCGGKLWPWGLFRLLWGRRSIRDLRVMTLAVRRPFRPLGLPYHLISRLWHDARARGYRMAEFGYIDTENRAMRRLADRLDARTVKRYRLYRKLFQARR